MTDMASRAVADFDDIFALRLKREIFIKRRNTIDSRFAHIKLFCKTGEDLLRKIVVMLLNFLQNGDDCLLLAIVSFDDCINYCEIEIVLHLKNLLS